MTDCSTMLDSLTYMKQLSPLPFPMITFEVGVAVEFIAQAFCMSWHKGRTPDALWTVKLVNKCLHPLAGADDESTCWIGGGFISRKS